MPGEKEHQMELARLVAVTVSHEQLAPVLRRIEDLERWRTEMDVQLRELTTAVHENKAVTKEVRDLMLAGRMLKKGADGVTWLGKFLGQLALWAAALYGAWHSFRGPSGPG